MARFTAVLILTALVGCSPRPVFVNIGNGKAVPSESIDAYAKEHGVSRQEAIRQMKADSNQASRSN